MTTPAVGSGLTAEAFRTALIYQTVVAVCILVPLVTWAWVRARRRRAAGQPVKAQSAARQLLVLGFGNLWLFDGFLQAQPQMAGGLPSQVTDPAAGGSPDWVRSLVDWAGVLWADHPVAAATAAVWIQIGIGVWLLMTRGQLSRLAGVASAAWGLVVWIFGEAFGGLLAPGGLSWLGGAPGAAALYVVAGVLIALPEQTWLTPRAGRRILAWLGGLLVVMAVAQAWPGRGFWQGTGALSAMTGSMALTPQPLLLAKLVAAFTAFEEAHGFAVNLFVVVALGLTGTAFITGRTRLIRPALAGLAGLCLAAWVLVQDLGFLGGLGTDPNSMIPFVLLAASGYLALVRPLGYVANVPPAAAQAALPGAAQLSLEVPSDQAAGLGRVGGFLGLLDRAQNRRAL